VITLENLVKTYPARGAREVAAVNGVSLHVEPGQFFTLLGPSGCGKTTTLRMLAGLAEPDSGTISVGDRLLYDGEQGVDVPAHRRGLGMVFQSYAIWPHMTVFRNVAFPLSGRFRRGKSLGRQALKTRVRKVLQMVQLDELEDRPATDLSGGQQQRLALARALVTEPQVLLLDEPLSNLDAKLRESMRFELKSLQRDLGITTVYVTHDQNEALALSNAIAVMNHGQIEQIGHPRDVYDRPASHFVADFIGISNFLDGVVESSAGPDRWRISTSIADVDVESAAPLNAGDKVTLSIRPEHVRMTLSEGEPSGRASGRIEARAFQGDSVHHQVRVGDQVIRVQCNPSVTFAKDDVVEIGFPSEWCAVIPGLSH
jgi:iron(III) transport system ATP-binding protein